MAQLRHGQELVHADRGRLFGPAALDLLLAALRLRRPLVALAAAYFLVGAHRRRPWDALMFAASPLLLLDSLVNWDLLAVACVAGAFWAWARGKPILTGVFIGLGTATKLYPLFLLGAMLVVCLRRREIGVFLTSTAAAVATWLVLDLPVMLTGFEQWKAAFDRDRGD